MTLLDILPSLGRTVSSRWDRTIWPATPRPDDEGRACVRGVPLAELADELGTPTYVLDETDFRLRARRYRKALRDIDVVYAGKSLLTTAVARWAREEGLGLAVWKSGELAVALAGGVDPARIVLHGDANSPEDLREATRVGVGRIVLDSPIEIAHLAGLARRRQPVLVAMSPDLPATGDIRAPRVAPTGRGDRRFAPTPAGDHAAEAARHVLAHPSLYLVGLHCGLGSQLSDAARYGEAIHRMIAVMADLRTRHGVILTELNLGGGHAISYVSGEAALDIDELAAVIEDALDEACAAEHFPRPAVVVEP